MFERASRLDGQAASQREDGWVFNRGAHALYPGGAASAAFRELGVTYRYDTGTPTDVYVLQGGQFRPLPASILTFARAHLAPRDQFELLKFFAVLPKLSAPSLAWTSVQTWLEHSVQRPQICTLVAGIVRPCVYSAALDAGAQIAQGINDVGGGRLIAAVRDAEGTIIGLQQG